MKDTERERFEQWAYKNMLDLSTHIADGSYYFSSTRFAWEAWQAASTPPEGYVLVPREPSEAMIDAALVALANWRKTLDKDEAMMRSYQAHDRKFIASATPEEKTVIRYKAMIEAAVGDS